MKYSDVKKVICVSILYFDLGVGDDYIYRGTTRFEGIHNHSILQLDEKQKLMYGIQEVKDIYPEYYLINLRKFHDETHDSLDEWIYFLKNSEVKDEFTARGLREAREKLEILLMSEPERKSYDRYVNRLRDEASFFDSSFVRGKLEGREEGREEGITKVARNMITAGMNDEVIIQCTGLAADEIENIRKGDTDR